VDTKGKLQISFILYLCSKQLFMARIAGIKIEKDAKGRPAYARFNLKKFPEALELLQKYGALEDDNDFEKEWERGISGEELMNRLKPRIKKLFDK
jgi:hypothetical protein